MVSLDALVVVTALPAIHRSVGGAIGTLEWAVNAYALTFAAGIITAAALGERLGRRRVYVTGLVVFTLASAACAVAPNASLLIAARAVQGLGAAAVTPLALTILAAAFPAERRGAVVGIFGGISGLAVAGGPLVGGAVTQGLDWHWIFWINVPIGVCAVARVAAVPAGRDGPRARRRLRRGLTCRVRCSSRAARPCSPGGSSGSAGPAGATRSGSPGCWRARGAHRVRGLGTAGGVADAAAAALPRAGLRGGQRHRVHVVRCDHVGGLPHRAVLPAWPRVLAADGRAAAAAVDGDADDRRARGRRARGPGRHQAAACRRAGTAGGRPGVGRAARVGGARLAEPAGTGGTWCRS